MDTERRHIPTFLQERFRFEGGLLVPEHYDAAPKIAHFAGTWAVFGEIEDKQLLNFALDVTDANQAELLAEAKKEYFEDLFEKYSRTLSVYIRSPDGARQTYYTGRKR